MDFNSVGRVNQDLSSRAVALSRTGLHTVFGQPLHGLVRIEPLDTESNVWTKGCGSAALGERNELWSESDSKDGNPRLRVLLLPWHARQPHIPFQRALDIRHNQLDMV